MVENYLFCEVATFSLTTACPLCGDKGSDLFNICICEVKMNSSRLSFSSLGNALGGLGSSTSSHFFNQHMLSGDISRRVEAGVLWY